MSGRSIKAHSPIKLVRAARCHGITSGSSVSPRYMSPTFASMQTAVGTSAFPSPDLLTSPSSSIGSARFRSDGSPSLSISRQTRAPGGPGQMQPKAGPTSTATRSSALPSSSSDESSSEPPLLRQTRVNKSLPTEKALPSPPILQLSSEEYVIVSRSLLDAGERPLHPSPVSEGDLDGAEGKWPALAPGKMVSPRSEMAPVTLASEQAFPPTSPGPSTSLLHQAERVSIIPINESDLLKHEDTVHSVLHRQDDSDCSPSRSAREGSTIPDAADTHENRDVRKESFSAPRQTRTSLLRARLSAGGSTRQHKESSSDSSRLSKLGHGDAVLGSAVAVPAPKYKFSASKVRQISLRAVGLHVGTHASAQFAGTDGPPSEIQPPEIWATAQKSSRHDSRTACNPSKDEAPYVMSGTSCEQDIKHDGVVAQTEEHLSLPSPDSFDPLEAARSEASWMRGDVKSVRRSTSSNPAAFTIYQDDLPREVRHDAKDIGQHSPSFEVSNPTRTSSKAEPAASAIHERLGSQSYRVKRLSGRHPSHGPTLRISPDADRLVLGDHSSDKVHSTGSKFGKKATNLHRAVVTSELMKSSQWGKPKVERMPKSRPHSASAYFGSRDENTMTPQRQQSRPMSVVCYSSPSDQNQTISRRQDRLPLAVQPSHPPIDTSLLPVHPLSLDIETKPPDLISDEEPVQISQTDSQNPIPDSNDPRLAPKVTTAPAHARIVRSESTPTTQHSPPRNTVQQIRYATDADDCISPVLQMVSEDRTVDSLKYGYPAASASEHSITVRGGQGQRVASPLPQSDRVASPASENDVRPRQRTAKLAKTSAEAQKQSTTGPGIPSMQVDCNAGKTSNRGNRRSQKPTSTGTAKKPLKADSHGESQSKKILSMNHLRSLFRSTARGSSADIERAAPHFTDDGLGKLSKDSRDSQCVPMLGNDKHINRVLEASGGGSTPATDVASAASKPGISHGQNRASSDGFTRPTAFAMHLLKSARNETQTPKKEQLLEMGKVMVDAITSARDADRAQEEAKVAAGRAEMAAVMTRKSVVRMTDLLREWQQDATKAVGQDEVKRRL